MEILNAGETETGKQGNGEMENRTTLNFGTYLCKFV